MTVYLDIIFCENILMNYIILCASLVITKSKSKHPQIRILISSLLGSIYAIIIYLNILEAYSNIIAKILLSIVMVYIALAPQDIKELLKKLLIFYLVSFIFGGCTVALMYVIKPENIQIKNGVFVGIYPIKVAIIAGGIAFIITQIAFKINKAKFTAKDMICKLKIFNENKTLELKAFVDTGNMLKEPISGFPVIIVEKDSIKQIIPQEFFEYIQILMGGGTKNKKETIKEAVINQYASKIRMIPFMSLGNENGMLIGIRVEKVKIENENKEQEIKNVIVGIYNKKLTKDNKYNALVGLNLLEKESEENELITNF